MIFRFSRPLLRFSSFLLFSRDFSMTAISQNELNRILSSVDGNRRTESCDVPRREQLKQISDARVATWKDTLSAQRKTKIEWKAEKERLEEEKRKKLDAEEAAIRETQRLETIARADHLLREQTEKVRQFRSTQKLVDTLDTRDEQIKAKEQQKKLEAEAEKQWYDGVITSIKEAEQKAIFNAEIEERKSKELADDLKRQRDQRAEMIHRQQQCKRAEEEAIIKKIAWDDAAAEKREAQLKNERRRKTKKEIMSNEVLLKTRKEQLQKKERELTKKCEDEVRRQNSINAARLALEQKHFEEKQAVRKILSDRASEDLRQRAEREFAIFERDRKMRQQKELAKAEAERQKQERDRIAIDQSRKLQIRLKKEEQEADRELSRLYIDQLNKISSERLQLERQKELTRRQENIKVRTAQYEQCQENAKRREEERLATLKQEQKVCVDCSKFVLAADCSRLNVHDLGTSIY